MFAFKIIFRCPHCGARNRIRLPAGKKVLVRCGNCGEPLPVGRRRILLLALGRAAKKFFLDTLPSFLLAVTETLSLILGVVFKPLRLAWRRLPGRLRRTAGAAALVLLLLAYVLAEGTVRLSALLLLIASLLLASLAVVFLVRGPRALRDMLQRVADSLFRRCRACGYRYFGWVRRCPRCGEQ